ncbi:MAG: hypothetical protein KHZ90_09700 [Veillonella parvula]|uniref:Topo IIA-type catalytic domain-containing protein n=1 Tax=Veillonella parvula TaxID=29466 RepID=A0A942WNL1_VEIPA|nr:DNA topoisomerase (ATP-hydrolyzing) subunit A [Veillonella parvula]MBS4894029.1 hypothetical protein [Veillonella parvula]
MITNKNIDNIIEENMSDYSAYVVLNRAIPDLRDATKPVHKRIIYAMHKEKATKFMKSATMSGKVMAYHPHGDTYPTIVGMVQKDNQLLPWLVGKGNFSQHTSRDLMYGSSRYTEVKLSDFTIDVLKDLNNHSIDFIPNYDGTKLMPEVLPVRFPTILHYCQSGIGVGMASNIPSFNMKEISDAIEKYIKYNQKTMLIPDFATGGQIILSNSEIEKINKDGKGSIKLRAKYKVENNSIVVTEIPYTTTREAIIEKIIDLIKEGTIKDIISVKDTTDLRGMSITIKYKKNTDVEKLMTRLYLATPLESIFSANMNVICDKLPKVMGVWDIIDKWLEWRSGCIVKSYNYEISELNKKIHLYSAFIKVINCIDDIIEIIRFSEEDMIVPNLIKKLTIDKEQAEYIADIKLRNLNSTFVKKRISEIDNLRKLTSDKYDFINNKDNILKTIVKEINEVSKKYSKPRKTEIVYEDKTKEISADEFIEDYSCNIIYTKENYLKKTLRYSDAQKVKDGDEVISMIQTSNKGEVILFSDKQNAYKLQINDLDSKQPSMLGLYIPSLIKLNKDENIIGCVATNNYKGFAIITYENGKIHKLPLESFRTNTKRSMLKNTLIDSPIVSIIQIEEDTDIYLESSQNKALVINTENINEKASRNSQGIQVMHSNKEGFRVVKAELYKNQVNYDDYITNKKCAGKLI